ncbi:hypothetical protein MHBO_002774, partial [Bonamia ostreae]
MLKQLEKWPDHKNLQIERFGGKRQFLRLLKLLSAESLSSKEKSTVSAQSDIKSRTALEKTRLKLLQIFENEASSETKSTPIITKEIFNDEENLALAANSVLYCENGENDSLTMRRLISEECVVHFIQAANNPIPTISVSSPGSCPYKAFADKKGKLHIPGARALYITFDSRCSLSSDLMTFLKFYADEERTQLLSSNRGGKDGYVNRNYSSFVVQSNKCYYHFRSTADNNYWGYIFKVHPVDLRIDDSKAINCMNIELAFWMFNTLIPTRSDLIKIDENLLRLYDALAWYVSRAKRGSKLRGVQLLNRIARGFYYCPFDKTLSNGRIANLSEQVALILKKVFKTEKKSSKLISQLVQSFSELHSILKLVSTKTEKKTLDSPNTQNLEQIGKYFFTLKKAAVFKENEEVEDITESAKRYLKQYLNRVLVIPSTNNGRNKHLSEKQHGPGVVWRFWLDLGKMVLDQNSNCVVEK